MLCFCFSILKRLLVFSFLINIELPLCFQCPSVNDVNFFLVFLNIDDDLRDNTRLEVVSIFYRDFDLQLLADVVYVSVNVFWGRRRGQFLYDLLYVFRTTKTSFKTVPIYFLEFINLRNILLILILMLLI